MIGVVFATHGEARPLLARSEAEELAGRPFPLFRISLAGADACLAVVSGMGKVAAAMAGSFLVLNQQVRMLISAGLCGRLNLTQPWAVGDLFRVTRAVEGDCDRFGRSEAALACDPQWFRQYPGARLVTCDRPVFGPGRRTRLAGLGDLADMEGAAVARVAESLGISCAMIKGISDIADEDGRKAVAENLDWVSSRIAGALMDALMDKTV